MASRENLPLNGEGISSLGSGEMLGKGSAVAQFSAWGQNIGGGGVAGAGPGQDSWITPGGLCQGLCWAGSENWARLQAGPQAHPQAKSRLFPPLHTQPWASSPPTSVKPGPGWGPGPAPLLPAHFPAPSDPGPAASKGGSCRSSWLASGRWKPGVGPALAGWLRLGRQASRPRQRSGGISELPTGCRPEAGAGLGWPSWLRPLKSLPPGSEASPPPAPLCPSVSEPQRPPRARTQPQAGGSVLLSAVVGLRGRAVSSPDPSLLPPGLTCNLLSRGCSACLLPSRSTQSMWSRSGRPEVLHPSLELLMMDWLLQHLPTLSPALCV